MDYPEVVSYIDSFINFEKIPRYNYASAFRLERMRAFLGELGNPHQELKTIHVAGSKGKGSACAILASILSAAGYRVGLYTSPHLVDVRERIKIVHKSTSHKCTSDIEERDFVELIERIRPIAERFRDHPMLGRLSFFEILTACAFLYFREKKVDFSVLETGLGGRLDATNVSEPVVCGMTSISLEHTDKLGATLREIAAEKAGIIKSGRTVVTAPQEKEVIAVIRGVCGEKNAALREINKDIKYSVVKSGEKGQVFDIAGAGYSYKNLEINLIGMHQVENAVVAVGLAKEVSKIDEGPMRCGLKDVFWPGRLQVVETQPYVVLDGAHNIDSIKKALSSVKEIFAYKRLICIFGVSSDKDIRGMSTELDKACDIIILTRSEYIERAEDPADLAKNFSRPGVEITYTVGEALEKALHLARQEDLILVTGSLYVVGGAIKNRDSDHFSKKNGRCPLLKYEVR